MVVQPERAERSAAFVQHRLIQRFVARRHGFPALVAGDGQAAFGQGCAQVRFVAQALQGLGQLGAVARVLQDQRVLAGRQILGKAAVCLLYTSDAADE